eukprot:1284140-Karenia_brevis.AAC.1
MPTQLGPQQQPQQPSPQQPAGQHGIRCVQISNTMPTKFWYICAVESEGTKTSNRLEALSEDDDDGEILELVHSSEEGEED